MVRCQFAKAILPTFCKCAVVMEHANSESFSIGNVETKWESLQMISFIIYPCFHVSGTYLYIAFQMSTLHQNVYMH